MSDEETDEGREVETDFTIPRIRRCADGLLLLLERGATDISGEHDALYAGGADTEPGQLDLDTKNQLNRLGWAWDNEVESWRFFT